MTVKFCRDVFDPATHTWTCSECGSTIDFPCVRNCPFTRKLGEIEQGATGIDLSWFVCADRGPALPKTTTGNVAGCGCGSTVVPFFECKHFREPVLKQCAGWAAEANREKLRVACPGYAGRTCRDCPVPREQQPKRKPQSAHVAERFDVAAHIAAAPYHAVANNVAAVTCYFNPQRSAARLRCYETFTQQFPKIGLELFTAEGSTDGRFEIPGAWQFALDPDAHLFAKENLLNLAIARLPDRFERVLWIDADVVLTTPGYADLLAAELDRHPVAQGFQEVRYLGPNGEPQSTWRSSIGFINAQNGSSVADPVRGYPGLAWAARRDVLVSGGGIYDRVITGGGDVAWCVGAWGDLRPRYSGHWSSALTADVHCWAAGMRPLIRSVGYVPARGVHLYHGRLTDRQYVRRNEILGEVGYDPTRDLEYAPNGTLRWSAAAPDELKQAVRAYIHGRREDQ